LRKQGDITEDNKMIIVYTYVVGDILHRGHIEYLKNARALGDKLIVAVLTDKAVMEKKPKPVMSFDERFDLIGGLKMVDIVVMQNKYSPIKNIAHIQPDILVESIDHEHVNDRYLKFIRNMGIRVTALPYYPGRSSTEVKNEIKRRAD